MVLHKCAQVINPVVRLPAFHATHNIFESDETDAALLVDASNAFNSLNRAAALHNVRVLCPIIATYAINTYRAPARLTVFGGKELLSSEGNTQGDPLAMSLYAISLQPLITLLGIRSSAKQCWYADDATGAGAFTDIRKWWDELLAAGPALGYYPNAKKCWLAVKPEKLKEANYGNRNKHHHGREQTPWYGTRTEVVSRGVCGQQSKGVD